MEVEDSASQSGLYRLKSRTYSLEGSVPSKKLSHAEARRRKQAFVGLDEMREVRETRRRVAMSKSSGLTAPPKTLGLAQKLSENRRRLENINRRRPCSASTILPHKALPKALEHSERSLGMEPNRSWENVDTNIENQDICSGKPQGKKPRDALGWRAQQSVSKERLTSALLSEDSDPEEEQLSEDREFVRVQQSFDPAEDFRNAIMDTIIEHQLTNPEDIEALFSEYKRLNRSGEAAKVLREVIKDIREEIKTPPVYV